MNIWIILLAIVAILILARFMSFRHKLSRVMVICLVLLFIFLSASFFVAIKGQSIDFKTPSGFIKAGKIYFSWLGLIFDNIKTISAEAINLNWIPQGKNLSDYNPKNIMRG